MTAPAQFKGFPAGEIPVLETERLRLRGHTLADIAAIAAMWSRDGTARFTGGQTRSHQTVWKQTLRTIGSWALLGYGFWVIETKDTGTFIGEAGFLEVCRDMTPPITGTPETGWVIDEPHWGKGYASEALAAMLAWSDKSFGDTGTCCIIDHDNAASIRAATKAGFTGAHEAVLDGEPILVFNRTPGASPAS